MEKEIAEFLGLSRASLESTGQIGERFSREKGAAGDPRKPFCAKVTRAAGDPSASDSFLALLRREQARQLRAHFEEQISWVEHPHGRVAWLEVAEVEGDEPGAAVPDSGHQNGQVLRVGRAVCGA